MENFFSKQLMFLSQEKNIAFLYLGKKGIEKENIRVDDTGTIISTEYPLTMGKALTHKFITKDYANAMLELVSPAFKQTKKMLDFFFVLHHYIYKTLPENLWITSCPPKFLEETPIASFGNSNKAKFKEYYRSGLKHRYGDKVQLFSGVHFNYSFHPATLECLKKSGFIKDKNTAYFAVLRNFLRYEFILIFLFGASPFSLEEQTGNSKTIAFPYATSQRSQIYKNKKGFNISCNSLQEYIKDLLLATKKQDDEYQKIGLRNREKYLQLNTNKIQIENEFYQSIRPKPISENGTRTLNSLQNHGVEYLECRSLDLDPFSLLGIEETTVDFLEIFFYFCLLYPSPPIKTEEVNQILQNNRQVSFYGRKKKTTFIYQNSKKNLHQIQRNIFPYLENIASLLDSSSKTNNYSKTVVKQKNLFYNINQTPSAKLEKIMQKIPLWKYILQESKKKKEKFLNTPLKKEWKNYFQEQAEDSIKKWEELEKQPLESFEVFFSNYLNTMREL